VGRLVAEQVTTGAITSVDVTCMSADRFSGEGAAVRGLDLGI
ncbi:MAG: hypothetical protein JWQ15_463, partial [Marmoricola sp.]|nr:hypothetical protein [Marmoricola sp.]